ncbi:MAG: cadherin-like domain-containing protein [Thermodesulfobacteriota bacterium]
MNLSGQVPANQTVKATLVFTGDANPGEDFLISEQFQTPPSSTLSPIYDESTDSYSVEVTIPAGADSKSIYLYGLEDFLYEATSTNGAGAFGETFSVSIDENSLINAVEPLAGFTPLPDLFIEELFDAAPTVSISATPTTINETGTGNSAEVTLDLNYGTTEDLNVKVNFTDNPNNDEYAEASDYTVLNYDGVNASTWSASTAVTEGDFYVPTEANGRFYMATNDGTTGLVEPTAWPTTTGGTITDGDVTWQDMGTIEYVSTDNGEPQDSSFTFTIPAESQEFKFIVQSTEDDLYELNEEIILTVDENLAVTEGNYTVDQNGKQAFLTIQDDDGTNKPSVTLTLDTTGAENDFSEGDPDPSGTATYTVTLSGPSGIDTEVEMTFDGTATYAADALGSTAQNQDYTAMVDLDGDGIGDIDAQIDIPAWGSGAAVTTGVTVTPTTETGDYFEVIGAGGTTGATEPVWSGDLFRGPEFTAGMAVEIGDTVVPSDANANGHYYMATSAGTGTTGTEPNWTTDGSTTIADANGVIWEDMGLIPHSYSARSASTTYADGDFVVPAGANANGHYYKAEIATGTGDTGTDPVTWPVDGSSVTDNEVTWQDMGLIGTVDDNGVMWANMGAQQPGVYHLTIPADDADNMASLIVMPTPDLRFEGDETVIVTLPAPAADDAYTITNPPLSETADLIDDDEGNRPEVVLELVGTTDPPADTATLNEDGTATFKLSLQDSIGDPLASGKDVDVTVNLSGGSAVYNDAELFVHSDVSTWTAGTAIQDGDLVFPPAGVENGHYYKANGDGTTSSAGPTDWPTDGTSVGDGTVTWVDMGLIEARNLPVWETGTLVEVGQIVIPPQETVIGSGEENDHYYVATTAGTTGTTDPAWVTDGSSFQDGTVFWQDLGPVADRQADFQVLSGAPNTFTIQAGQTELEFTVKALTDGIYEKTEYIWASIDAESVSDPAGGTAGAVNETPDEVSAKIDNIDDMPTVTLTLDPASFEEIPDSVIPGDTVNVGDEFILGGGNDNDHIYQVIDDNNAGNGNVAGTVTTWPTDGTTVTDSNGVVWQDMGLYDKGILTVGLTEESGVDTTVTLAFDFADPSLSPSDFTVDGNLPSPTYDVTIPAGQLGVDVELVGSYDTNLEGPEDIPISATAAVDYEDLPAANLPTDPVTATIIDVAPPPVVSLVTVDGVLEENPDSGGNVDEAIVRVDLSQPFYQDETVTLAVDQTFAQVGTHYTVSVSDDGETETYTPVTLTSGTLDVTFVEGDTDMFVKFVPVDLDAVFTGDRPIEVTIADPGGLTEAEFPANTANLLNVDNDTAPLVELTVVTDGEGNTLSENGGSGFLRAQLVDELGNPTTTSVPVDIVVEFHDLVTQNWAPETAYQEGDLVIPENENGRYYMATNAGTSGAADPFWTGPGQKGDLVNDGTVQWQDMGLVSEAELDVDYTTTAPFTMTIPAGSDDVTGPFAFFDGVDDTGPYEGSESIFISIDSVTNARPANPDGVEAVLIDDEPGPTVSLGLTTQNPEVTISDPTDDRMNEYSGIGNVRVTMTATSPQDEIVYLNFGGDALYGEGGMGAYPDPYTGPEDYIAYSWIDADGNGSPSEGDTFLDGGLDVTVFAPDWMASTAKAEGDVVLPSDELNDNYYKALTAGTTGTAEPDWGIIASGEAAAPAAETDPVAAGDFFKSPADVANGHYYRVVGVGTTAAVGQVDQWKTDGTTFTDSNGNTWKDMGALGTLKSGTVTFQEMGPTSQAFNGDGSWVLTVPEGETEVFVSLDTLNDTDPFPAVSTGTGVFEPDENITVQIAGFDSTLQADATNNAVEAFIIDDDDALAPTLSLNFNIPTAGFDGDIISLEENSEVFYVYLDDLSQGDIDVVLQFSGEAVHGEDYRVAVNSPLVPEGQDLDENGQLAFTIPAGYSGNDPFGGDLLPISIQVMNDDVYEGDETIQIEVLSAIGAEVNPAEDNLTLTIDDQTDAPNIEVILNDNALTGAPDWTGEATVAAGDQVLPSGIGDGFYYESTTAGTTGSTEPAWEDLSDGIEAFNTGKTADLGDPVELGSIYLPDTTTVDEGNDHYYKAVQVPEGVTTIGALADWPTDGGNSAADSNGIIWKDMGEIGTIKDGTVTWSRVGPVSALFSELDVDQTAQYFIITKDTETIAPITVEWEVYRGETWTASTDIYDLLNTPNTPPNGTSYMAPPVANGFYYEWTTNDVIDPSQPFVTGSSVPDWPTLDDFENLWAEGDAAVVGDYVTVPGNQHYYRVESIGTEGTFGAEPAWSTDYSTVTDGNGVVYKDMGLTGTVPDGNIIWQMQYMAQQNVDYTGPQAGVALLDSVAGDTYTLPSYTIIGDDLDESPDQDYVSIDLGQDQIRLRLTSAVMESPTLGTLDLTEFVLPNLYNVDPGLEALEITNDDFTPEPINYTGVLPGEDVGQLAEGGTVNLTLDMLYSEDQDAPGAPDNPDYSGLIYNVAESVQNGDLWVDANANGTFDSGEEIVAGGSFTQGDIAAGNVYYTHGGGDGPMLYDEFSFTVSDGTNETAPPPLVFTFEALGLNDPPTVQDDIYFASENVPGTPAYNTADLTPGDVAVIAVDDDAGAELDWEIYAGNPWFDGDYEWSSETVFFEGDLVYLPVDNDHYYKALNSGYTGTVEPVWPTDGSTVTDGDIVWQDMGLWGPLFQIVEVGIADGSEGTNIDRSEGVRLELRVSGWDLDENGTIEADEQMVLDYEDQSFYHLKIAVSEDGFATFTEVQAGVNVIDLPEEGNPYEPGDLTPPVIHSDQPYLYRIPDDVFPKTDETVIYTANNLPSWLNFAPDTASFWYLPGTAGVPTGTSGDIVDTSISVTASYYHENGMEDSVTVPATIQFQIASLDVEQLELMEALEQLEDTGDEAVLPAEEGEGLAVSEVMVARAGEAAEELNELADVVALLEADMEEVAVTEHREKKSRFMA